MQILQKGTSWTGTWDISRTARVYLDAAPGDASLGGIRVHVGTSPVYTGPGVEVLDLGLSAALAGQKVLVTADIRRVASQATLTSLRVALRGGPEPLEIALSAAPVGDADVLYVVVIELKGTGV